MPAESYSDERLDATIAQLAPIFMKQFDVKGPRDVKWEMFTFAPGRVNFIGEHVDYMHGFVCPAALQEGTHILVGRVKHFAEESKNKLRFYATYNDKKFELESIGGKDHNKAWTTFIRGAVTLRLQHLGVDIDHPSLRGICMVVHGSLAMGAGMSASAAFGIALTHAVNSLVTGDYAKATISDRKYAVVPKLPVEDLVEIAKQARRIETDFCGVNVGIMDQFISAMAEDNSFMFLDCLTLNFKTHDLTPLLGDDYCWMLIDSMVKHDLLDGTANVYNAVRNDQENSEKKISAKIGKPFTIADLVRNPQKFCGDQDPVEFFKSQTDGMTEGERNRGTYQVMEQLRTLQFRKLTLPETQMDQKARIDAAGKILNIAHEGMRDLMKITTPELDLVQEIATKDPDVAGGRMMGGGFGGCIIMLLKKSAQDRVLASVRKVFQAKYKLENTCYHVEHAGCGAFVVSLASGPTPSNI